MSQTHETQIEATIREAINKVLEIQRQHMAAALGLTPSTPVAAAPVVTPSTTVSAKKPKSTPAPKKTTKAEAAAANAAKGVKRDPAVLEALKTKILTYIASNPGKRIEEITKDLGTVTKYVTLPVKKLIAEKKVRTEGEKRSTAYFPR